MGPRGPTGESAAGLPAVRSLLPLHPLHSPLDGLWGTDGISPNNGDPERQHRHVTPGLGRGGLGQAYGKVQP